MCKAARKAGAKVVLSTEDVAKLTAPAHIARVTALVRESERVGLDDDKLALLLDGERLPPDDGHLLSQ